jgi:hypothetical protein
MRSVSRVLRVAYRLTLLTALVLASRDIRRRIEAMSRS